MGAYVQQERINFDLEFTGFNAKAIVHAHAIISGMVATLYIPSFTATTQSVATKLRCKLPGILQPIQKYEDVILIFVNDPVIRFSGTISIDLNGNLEIGTFPPIVFPDGDFPASTAGQGFDQICKTYPINPLPI